MIIAWFPNGDWCELRDSEGVDFVEIDGGESVESALSEKHYRFIASAAPRVEGGFSYVRLNDKEGRTFYEGRI